MRFVSIPEHLSLFSLLVLDELPTFLLETLGRIRVLSKRGELEEAYRMTQDLLDGMRRREDWYTFSIVAAYRAELAWRLWRWGEALEHIESSLEWLRMQVTPVGRYNEALAVYFAGLLHYGLRLDSRAIQAFLDVQEHLEHFEEQWRLEGRYALAESCRAVLKWVASLLQLQRQSDIGEPFVVIVPLYERAGEGYEWRDTIDITDSFQEEIPSDRLHGLSPYSKYPPETSVRFSLPLSATYAAIHILHEDELELARGVQRGDLLIVEVVAPLSPDKGVTLKDERTFVRRRDGHIAFRPVALGEEFVGIPRLILRSWKERLTYELP